MYDWDKEVVVNLYKRGFSKYAIAKKTGKSWQSVDIVIDRYLDEIERDQEAPPKPKKAMSGTLAIYVVAFLGLLALIFYLVARWNEVNSLPGEKEKKPPTRKENLFDPGRDLDNDEFAGGGGFESLPELM